MRGPAMRCRVERATDGSDLLDVRVAVARLHRHVVAKRLQRAIARGAEPYALQRERTLADEVKHLLAGERDLDRVAEHARSDRSQDRLGVNAELRSEAAADESRDDVDVRRI